MIGRLISTWMLALVGSLLLPLVSVAAVSGTTYDATSTTTTEPATIAEHTVAIETVDRGESSLQSMASGQVWSLLGLSHFLNAAKSATAVVKYDPAFAVRQGAPAYRLWGEGTIEAGRSWTTVNPRSFATAEEFKQAAGLGEWVRPPYRIATGEFRALEGVSSRTALPVQTAPNPWLPELRVQPPQSVGNAIINISSEPW